MSGIIGSVISAGSAIAGFFGGNTGSLVLGNVEFQKFELPEGIPMGGQQSLVVNDYAGGRRNISTRGPFEADITWSGIFLGANAISRYQALDTLRVNGAAIVLTFSQFSFLVVIRSFTGQYQRPNHIPYTLSVAVLARQSSNAAAGVLPGILGTAVKDLGQAAGFAANISQDVVDAVQTAQQVVGAVAPVLGGSPIFANILGKVTSVNTLFQGAAEAANGNIGGLITAGAAAGNLFGSTSVYDTANGFAQVVGAVSTLHAAVDGAAFVGRTITNLGSLVSSL